MVKTVGLKETIENLFCLGAILGNSFIVPVPTCWFRQYLWWTMGCWVIEMRSRQPTSSFKSQKNQVCHTRRGLFYKTYISSWGNKIGALAKTGVGIGVFLPLLLVTWVQTPLVYGLLPALSTLFWLWYKYIDLNLQFFITTLKANLVQAMISGNQCHQ